MRLQEIQNPKSKIQNRLLLPLSFFIFNFAFLISSPSPTPSTPLPDQAHTTSERKAEAERLLQQGIQQLNTSQYQAAIQSWEQALAIYRAIQDRNGEARALNDLGNAYLFLSQYSKAIEFYQQALPTFQQVGDRNGEAKALMNLGAAYRSLSQSNKAIEYYQQALPIFRQVGDRNSEADALMNLVSIYRSLSQYGKAIEYYQQALPIYRQMGDRSSVEALALTNLSNAYVALSQYNEAIKFYQQALSIYQQVGDLNGESKVLMNLGAVYILLSQYGKAIKFLQQAVPIFRQVGDRSNEATALMNLSDAYLSLSQYAKSIEFDQQALPIFQQVGDRRMEAITLMGLGSAYFSLSQYGKAIEFYEQVLPIFRQIGDLNSEASVLLNLGRAYDSLSNHDRGIELYQQALLIFRHLGNRHEEAIALNELGVAYFSRSEYSKAIEFHQQALPIFQQVGDRNGEAKTLMNLGIAYNSASQYGKAIEYYQQALPIFRQVGDRAGEGQTLTNIGIVLQKQKQSELAILFYKQSVNVREAIRKDIRSLSREEQAAYAQSISDIYRRLADLLLQQGRVMEAMQVLDLLKVQELQDYLRDLKGNPLTAEGVPLLPQESKLLPLLNSNQPSLSQVIISPAVMSLVQQLQQTAAAQNLTLPAYQDLQSRIQRLGKRIALFYPLILDDRLELVLFIPDRPPIHHSISVNRNDLEAAITAFREDLVDPSALKATKRSGQQLYTWLIQPLEAELKQANIQTIVYAPDGKMRYVPLAALYDGNQWLTQRFQINYLTALALTPLDSPLTQPPTVLAGALTRATTVKVAGASYSFRPLSFTQPEVEQLTRLFPQSKSLIDQSFNRSNLLAQMPQSNLIHLATHAKFVAGTPDQSFIVLGDSSTVSLREIENWKLPNVSLFVLSACETALGEKLGNGLEILGFGYQMQRTGSRAAVASLWAVDDGGTQVLMKAFYAALTQPGMTKTKALQEAQIALITGDFSKLGTLRGMDAIADHRDQSRQIESPLSHPRYWAPFILIGNGL